MSFLNKLFGNENQEQNEEETDFFGIKKDKLISPKDAEKSLFKDETIEQIIQGGSLRFVKSKIDESNFREKDDMGRYPLYYATLYGKIDVIEYLFELGSDFEDARANELNTAMGTIIQSAKAEVLSTYLKHGYMFIETIKDKKAMCLAMIKCPLEFIELLIDMEVPMNKLEEKDGTSFTPIEYAMLQNREVEVIETLIKAGCQLKSNQDDSYLAFNIIDKVHEPVAKKRVLNLLQKMNKLDLSLQNEEGKTLIEVATDASDITSIKELILLGVNFNPFHHKIKRLLSPNDLQELAENIEKKGGDIGEFLSLLSYEAIKRHLIECDEISSSNIIYQIATNARIEEHQKVELLTIALEFGIDINENTPENTNTLFTVSKNLNINTPIDVAEFLLEHGASIEFEEQSAFLEAIYNYNMPLVKLFLEYGADVNFIDKNNHGVVSQFYRQYTTLNTITKKRELLGLLFKYGFDINTKIAYKNEEKLFSSFSVIIFEKEFKLIEYLIEQNITLTDEDIIYYGLMNIKKDSVLKKIIEINPYYKKEDYFERLGEKADGNILHIAINYQRENIVEYILDTYPDIEAYSELVPVAQTLFSSVNCSLELVEKFIKRDSDINRYYKYQASDKEPIYQSNLLHHAIYKASAFDSNHRYFYITKLLLENGADVNTPSKFPHRSNLHMDENTVFVQAFNDKKVNKELLDLLYEYGASLCKPTTNINEMPIHTIVQRYSQHKDDLAVEYLEYCWQKEPFDLEHKNSLDTTIFLGSAMSCLPKTLNWLANKGANIHIIGGHDNSPALHKAISNYENIETMQRVKTVQTLLELGVDMEQFDSDQMTPLMCAASVGVGQVVKELIKNGVDVNKTNESGENAIHHAILGTHSYDFKEQLQSVKSKIIIELVQNGAKIDQVVSDGATALIYAIRYGYREIFDTLIKLGADINTPCDDGYLPLYYAVYLKDQYFTNVLKKREDLEVNKTNKFHYSIIHQLLFVNFHPSILEEILQTLKEIKVDMNIHKDIDPPLLMYVKTMEFIGERQVGFVSSSKKPKENEENKAKLLIEYGADVELALDIAKKQSESKDIIQYLESLLDV